MDQPLTTTLVAAAVVVVGLLVTLVTVLVTGRSARLRREAELRASGESLAAVQARLDDLERVVAAAGPARDEAGPAQDDGRAQFLITDLTGDPGDRTPEAFDQDRAVTGREFASLAAGESLVRVVSLAHGVRRALSAEQRNRIGFEVRRQVKRSRKARRRDLKEAKRLLRTRQAPGRRPDLSRDAA